MSTQVTQAELQAILDADPDHVIELMDRRIPRELEKEVRREALVQVRDELAKAVGEFSHLKDDALIAASALNKVFQPVLDKAIEEVRIETIASAYALRQNRQDSPSIEAEEVRLDKETAREIVFHQGLDQLVSTLTTPKSRNDEIEPTVVDRAAKMVAREMRPQINEFMRSADGQALLKINKREALRQAFAHVAITVFEQQDKHENMATTRRLLDNIASRFASACTKSPQLLDLAIQATASPQPAKGSPEEAAMLEAQKAYAAEKESTAKPQASTPNWDIPEIFEYFKAPTPVVAMMLPKDMFDTSLRMAVELNEGRAEHATDKATAHDLFADGHNAESSEELKGVLQNFGQKEHGVIFDMPTIAETVVPVFKENIAAHISAIKNNEEAYWENFWQTQFSVSREQAHKTLEAKEAGLAAATEYSFSSLLDQTKLALDALSEEEDPQKTADYEKRNKARLKRISACTTAQALSTSLEQTLKDVAEILPPSYKQLSLDAIAEKSGQTLQLTAPSEVRSQQLESAAPALFSGEDEYAAKENLTQAANGIAERFSQNCQNSEAFTNLAARATASSDAQEETASQDAVKDYAAEKERAARIVPMVKPQEAAQDQTNEAQDRIPVYRQRDDSMGFTA